MTKISTLKKENENILPRTKIEGVEGLKEELEKISKYNETAIDQILRLVEQVSANKEAIEGLNTKITSLEDSNTTLEESNGTLSNQVETLQSGKQNKLIAGENTTLTDNKDGTTTISSTSTSSDKNVVTIDTAQTITGEKIFKDYIKTPQVASIEGKGLVRYKGVETASVFGNDSTVNVLMGNSTRPHYSNKGDDFSGVELALYSDIVSNKVNISQEVLWTNSDPSQAFVAQSVNLSSSKAEYDYLLFSFYNGIGQEKIGYKLATPTNPPRLSMPAADGTFNQIRQITYTNDTTVAFERELSQGSTDNTSIIPYQIIGVKFLDTLNYSTEEQYTGKHWIDGKKIYEKTFDCGSATSNKDLTVNVSNAEYITSIAGIAKTTSNTFIALGYNNSGNVQHCYNLYVADITETTLRLAINLGSGVPTSSMYITIQYTKTTE